MKNQPQPLLNLILTLEVFEDTLFCDNFWAGDNKESKKLSTITQGLCEVKYFCQAEALFSAILDIHNMGMITALGDVHFCYQWNILVF